MSHRPFSQRIGAVQVPEVLQLAEMSQDLRTTLWNNLLRVVAQGQGNLEFAIAEDTAFRVLKAPLDTIPGSQGSAREWLRRSFFDAPWYTVYEIIENFVRQFPEMTWPRHKPSRESLEATFNAVLAVEWSGYRFIAGELAPITSETELAAIREAIDLAARTGLGGVRAHLTTAIGLLAKKPDPDWRNSIKESISAVEAAVALIDGSGDRKLERALSSVEERTGRLHGAFRTALLSLYGYTSDENGIRHALLEEANVGFDEAKFMLVACSAFVHYLIGKAERAGVLTRGPG